MCAIFQAVDDNASVREEKSKAVYKRMRISYDSLKLMLKNHLKRRWREREKQSELYIILFSSLTTLHHIIIMIHYRLLKYCFIPKLLLLYKLLVLYSYGGVA